MLKDFSKANWVSFREYLEEIGRMPEPQDIHTDNKYFRKKITDAARMYIPVGNIPEIRPNFPTDVTLYVSLTQTIHISKHYSQISRRWSETYEQNGEHTWKM